MSGAEEQEDEGPSSPSEDQSPSSPGENQGPFSPGEDQSPSSPGENQGPSSPSEVQSPSSPGENQGPFSPSEDQSPSNPSEDQGPSSPREAPESVEFVEFVEFVESVESVEAHIDLRIHKLQNRLLFLQQAQRVIRRVEDTRNDDEDASELDLVERELQDLLQQKQNLCNKITPRSTGQVSIGSSSFKVETEGGIYTLPPLHFTSDILPQGADQNIAALNPPEEQPLPPDEPPLLPEEYPDPPVEHPAPLEEHPAPLEEHPAPLEEHPPPLEEELQDEQIEPAECLRQVGAFTLCPSCEQVVFTQTKKFNGEPVWLMSCIMGFAGLCLVAFCVDKLKSVRHMCPQCQTTIHTYHPM